MRDLVAVEDESSVDGARIEEGFATAPADRLELFERVRDLEQPTAARERDGLKVGADAVGEHGHVFIDRDAQQVVDLPFAEELHLVEQEAGDVFAGFANRVLAVRP